MNKIPEYINERFPPFQIFLFSLGNALFIVGLLFSNYWRLHFLFTVKTLVLLIGFFLFFLLRLRITDEFKDSLHDKKYYPNRAVPRGIISYKQLLSIGSIACLFELLCVYFLNTYALAYYSIVFLYSLLLSKEFFVPQFFYRHFTFSFFIHELIFMLFSVFYILTFISFNTRSLNSYISIWIILSLGPVVIELIRKFVPRLDPDGTPVLDSYSVMWGKSTATISIFLLSIALSLILTFQKHSLIFIGYFILILFIFQFLARRFEKGIVFAGAALYLGLAILSNFV